MTNILKLQRDVRPSADLRPFASAGPASREAERKIDLSDIAIEEVSLRPESRLPFHTDPHGCAADRYRLLRMRLRELWIAGRLKTLLVTSPLPEDGKSTTAMNLATALAEGGKYSVLLMEADLYHSPLAELLGIQRGPGLAECLEGTASLNSAIRRLQPLGWFVLPAGDAHGNPTELLHTEAFAQVMQKVVPCFDWVLIDSPPVVPLVDALLLKHHANATLLVTRAGKTPREAIEKSLSLLGREHVLGVVLNAVDGLNQLYSKYSKYYGNFGPKASKPK